MYSTVKRAPLSKRQTEQSVSLALEAVNADECEVSIHWIGDAAMRRLNREHRGKDKTTDVLSFATDDPASGDAGDIFLSAPQIRRQAKEHGVSAREEAQRMVVHGVLHLFGFDHHLQKEAVVMFGLQEELVDRLRAT